MKQSSYRMVWPDPWWNPTNSWDSRSTQGQEIPEMGIANTEQWQCGSGPYLKQSPRWQGSRLFPAATPGAWVTTTCHQLSIQQHPSLIQPCKGSKQLNSFKSVLPTKKLYGNLRVSLTQRLIQQPLVRFSFSSFQVILYLDLHNNLFCNSGCTM